MSMAKYRTDYSKVNLEIERVENTPDEQFPPGQKKRLLEQLRLKRDIAYAVFKNTLRRERG